MKEIEVYIRTKEKGYCMYCDSEKELLDAFNQKFILVHSTNMEEKYLIKTDDVIYCEIDDDFVIEEERLVQ